MGQTYLELFDNITYENLEIKNLFEQIDIDVEYLIEKKSIEYYRIIDGQTPDKIAQMFYNDKKLYWLPLKMNNMSDYFYDWPMSDKELKEFMDYYYEDQDDKINTLTNQLLQTGDDFDLMKANIKSELYAKFYTENDNKKTIKILKPEFLDSFLQKL
jgi:Base plate wedge protein 53